MALQTDQRHSPSRRPESGAVGAVLGVEVAPDEVMPPSGQAHTSAWETEWPRWSCNLGLVLLLGIDLLMPMAGAVSMGVLALLTFVLVPWSWFLLSRWSARHPRAHWFEVLAYALTLSCLMLVVLGAKWWVLLGTPAANAADYAGTSRSYTLALIALLGLAAVAGGRHLGRLAALVIDHPARLIAASFALTGLLGAFALSLPVSLQRVHELSILDNLFMSFSAVCITGLAVNVVSSTYTWVGQAIICLLVQVGGLGIMVLSAAVAVLTGQRMGVKRSAVLAEIVDAESLAQFRRFVIAIVVSTFAIEALGAAALYLQFTSNPRLFAAAAGSAAVHGPLWGAVFHAVSAFCNAGFSIFDAGLLPYVGHPGVLGSISLLVLAGGIGFPVLYELTRRSVMILGARRRQRMTLHARVALGATGVLLVAVAFAYLLLEWRRALGPLPWPERVLASIFQSVSCRTAGFNVVDIAAFGPAALMLTCLAMFVGACPGSCGGGLKVTTVAVLFAGLRSELQSRPPYLLDRALPPATIRKAIGVSFLSIGIVSVALFILLLLERQPPLELAFEVFSAFSTTGLSTGVTPRLSPSGKALILLTMFIGRIGPLTLALAVARRTEPVAMQLPAERVLIG